MLASPVPARLYASSVTTSSFYARLNLIQGTNELRLIAAVIATLLVTGAALAQGGAARPGGARIERPEVDKNANMGVIRGRIVTPQGAPVAEALKISLNSLRGEEAFLYTDLNGSFELTVQIGGYVLEVEGDREARFEGATERVEVREGETVIVTLHLKEKKSAAQPAPLNAVVPASELSRGVPAKAAREFERASRAAAEGKVPKAVEHLRKAISIHPEFLMAHNDLGTHLMALGQLDEAAAEFQEAIRLDPKAFHPRLNLGIILVQQHQFSEAISALNVARTLGGSSPAVRLYAGLASLGLGDLARAEQELRAAYELGGAKYTLALFHLGQLHLNRGEQGAALVAFEAYLRETPDAANAGEVRAVIDVLRRPQ